jgi:hypothetical protein
MSEECGQSDGDGHEAEREADGLGAVAAVLLALADESVVLLQNSLVEKNKTFFFSKKQTILAATLYPSGIRSHDP